MASGINTSKSLNFTSNSVVTDQSQIKVHGSIINYDIESDGVVLVALRFVYSGVRRQF